VRHGEFIFLEDVLAADDAGRLEQPDAIEDAGVFDVGRIAQPLRGRQLSDAEEGEEIRAVVAAKGAVLRASLDAVERLGMPFLGETQGRARDEKAGLPDHLHEAPHGLAGGASVLQAAIDAARAAAAEHEDHALNRTREPQKSDRTDLW
jgi:hypothetical protein